MASLLFFSSLPCPSNLRVLPPSSCPAIDCTSVNPLLSIEASWWQGFSGLAVQLLRAKLRQSIRINSQHCSQHWESSSPGWRWISHHNSSIACCRDSEKRMLVLLNSNCMSYFKIKCFPPCRDNIGMWIIPPFNNEKTECGKGGTSRGGTGFKLWAFWLESHTCPYWCLRTPTLSSPLYPFLHSCLKWENKLCQR